MNNKLSPYFENMKPVLPRICDNYGIRRPYFHLPLIKHDFAEQLLSYQLTTSLMKMTVRGFHQRYLHILSVVSVLLKNLLLIDI